MVGKTATNYQTVGVEAKTNGSLFATAASNAPLVVTRNTSDGNVASFYKDSTNAGNIAVTSNIISILGKDGDGGIAIQNNSYGDIVYPTSNSTGGASDNAIDLGYNNGRWKDLYLGGGAYIGGTVAANKLDDYEEGTFTAGLAGYYGMPNTAVTSTGQYTKIGNQVSFWISFENKDTTGASGNMWVTGLPFASSGNYEICWAQINTGGTFGSTSPFGLVSGTIVYFYYHVNNSGTAAVFHNAGTGRYIRTSGTYRVA